MQTYAVITATSPCAKIILLRCLRLTVTSLFAGSLAACGGGAGDAHTAATASGGTTPSAATAPAPIAPAPPGIMPSDPPPGMMPTNPPAPVQPAPPPSPPANLTQKPTRAEASRFLAQASFGATRAELDALTQSNLASWLDKQFNAPLTSYDIETKNLVDKFYGGNDSSGPLPNVEIIWRKFAYGNDQLRQRTVWALSQLFVVGKSSTPSDASIGPSFWDALNRNAFGNFRQLLEDVTLSSSMGLYLSYSGNPKEDPLTGSSPDENYGREIMQLFTVGLWMLNQDGSQILDSSGRPIPTYGQAEISGMAKVFTGWGFPRCQNPTASEPLNVCFEAASRLGWAPEKTLAAIESYHSTSEKKILTGKILPAGRPAGQDLKDTLDTLFNHPNVGPFIGKQLIQRFVTSNPSPGYVSRVAAKFADNGAGTRGDMKAVITAVLTDPEARDMARVTNDSHFGKVREPVLRWVNFLRTFTTPNPNGHAYYDFNWMIPAFGQWPYESPSVFNFYRPTYRPPGELSQAGMVAPEMQITHEYTIAASHNAFHLWTGAHNDASANQHLNDYDWLLPIATDPAKLVDTLDELLTYKSLSSGSRAAILSAVQATTYETERVRIALLLFFASPDYLVLK